MTLADMSRRAKGGTTFFNKKLKKSEFKEEHDKFTVHLS